MTHATIRIPCCRVNSIQRSDNRDRLLSTLSRNILSALLFSGILSAIPSSAIAQEAQAYAEAERELATGMSASQDTIVSMAFSPSSSSIASYCVAPSPPYGGAPRAPYCSPSSSCSSWDIERFEAQVDDYIDDMKQYLRDAQEFASCRVEEAVTNWNRFVNGY